MEAISISTFKPMTHLVNSFKKVTIVEALKNLVEAHDFLVERAKDSIKQFETIDSPWGIKSKRITVNLQCDAPPRLIGKSEERLSEIINMAATVERLIESLEWFGRNKSSLSVRICHPSTSDDKDGNDLVLENKDEEDEVLCEICDVISDNPNSNGKEKKDLKNLGCTAKVPEDGIERYICTSKEFGTALTGVNRKWQKKHYRYKQIHENGVDTFLLLVQPSV